MGSMTRKSTYQSKLWRTIKGTSHGWHNHLVTYEKATRTTLTHCLWRVQPFPSPISPHHLRYFKDIPTIAGTPPPPKEKNITPRWISTGKDAYGKQASPMTAHSMDCSTPPTSVASTARWGNLTFIWHRSSKPGRWEETDESHVHKTLVELQFKPRSQSRGSKKVQKKGEGSVM